jgi:hypothetical protein
MVNGSPVSIWYCTQCGVEGRGEVYITYESVPEFECWEPEGWLCLIDEVLCINCNPNITTIKGNPTAG